MSPTTTPLLSILRRVSDDALFSPRGEPSKASIEAYPILSSRGTLDRRRLSGDARVSATARCRRRTVDCPIVTSLFLFLCCRIDRHSVWTVPRILRCDRRRFRAGVVVVDRKQKTQGFASRRRRIYRSINGTHQFCGCQSGHLFGKASPTGGG